MINADQETGAVRDATIALERIVRSAKAGIAAHYAHGSLVGSPYADLMVAAFNLYMKSRDWEMNRETCLRAASMACADCGEAATIAHHASYAHWSMGDAEIDDLVPLCKRCHARRHSPSSDSSATPFWARRYAADGTKWLPADRLADVMQALSSGLGMDG